MRILTLPLLAVILPLQFDVTRSALAAKTAPDPMDVCIKNATARIKSQVGLDVRTMVPRLALVYCDGKMNQPKRFKSDFTNLEFLQSLGVNDARSFLGGVSVESLQAQALTDLTAVVANRPDKQTSSTPTAAGTTDLVTKAGGAELLALALDAGALTKTVNGSTATISGNLGGILSALGGDGPFPPLGTQQNTWQSLAGRVNLSAGFTLNQQSSNTIDTQPASTSGSQTDVPIALPSSVGKLSSITAKLSLWRKYDPHASGFAQKYNDAFEKEKASYSASVKELATEIDATKATLKAYKPDAGGVSQFGQDWASTKAKLEAAASQPTPDAFAAAYSAYFYSELTLAREADKDFDTNILKTTQAASAFEMVRQSIRDQARGSLGSIQYTFNHSAKEPESHDIALIYAYSPGGGNSTWSAVEGNVPQLSINGSASIYGGTLPVGAKYGRLHYGQASGEFDRPLSHKGKWNNAIWSTAAYWQYQPDPSVLNISQGDVAPGTTIDAPTQVLVGTAGSLWVLQTKVSYKAKGGINVPFGVKWSNKTDLLGSNKLGAQVGISYDFSSLSSLFGGSTAQQ